MRATSKLLLNMHIGVSSVVFNCFFFFLFTFDILEFRLLSFGLYNWVVVVLLLFLFLFVIVIAYLSFTGSVCLCYTQSGEFV